MQRDVLVGLPYKKPGAVKKISLKVLIIVFVRAVCIARKFKRDRCGEGGGLISSGYGNANLVCASPVSDNSIKATLR